MKASVVCVIGAFGLLLLCASRVGAAATGCLSAPLPSTPTPPVYSRNLQRFSEQTHIDVWLAEQARSRVLIAETGAVIAQSCVLYRRAHRITRRPLPMRGGSDAAGSDAGVVAAMIADARMCLHCIARKTGVPAAQANQTLVVIARSFRLKIGPHRCDARPEYKTTFSVTKNGQP